MSILKSALLSAVVVASTFIGQQAHAQVKVVFAQSNEVILWAPLYVARERGYLKEEGIDAEVISVKGGPATLAAVEANNAQIALGFPATPINAFSKGLKVKMFGSLSTEFVVSLMIQGKLAQEAGITADMPVKEKVLKLRGHSIATNAAGSANDYLLQNLAEYAGLKPDVDLTITPVGETAAVLAAFERQRIDGFMATPPADRMAEEKYGAYKLVDFARGEYEGVAGILYVAMTANEGWLSENRETAAKVLRAMDKSLKLIHEDEAAAKASVRTFFTGMDEKDFEAGWAGTVGSFPKTAMVHDESVVKILDFMELMSGSKVNVNRSDLYTNDYYDLSKTLQ